MSLTRPHPKACALLMMAGSAALFRWMVRKKEGEDESPHEPAQERIHRLQPMAYRLTNTSFAWPKVQAVVHAVLERKFAQNSAVCGGLVGLHERLARPQATVISAIVGP